jgi:predicted ABC-type transport system involved in lysophospholipase L1 biosynthesis ATPase subunit
MVPHSSEHAMRAKRTVKLLDGKIVSEALLGA